jgi:hypothetical protein
MISGPLRNVCVVVGGGGVVRERGLFLFGCVSKRQTGVMLLLISLSEHTQVCVEENCIRVLTILIDPPPVLIEHLVVFEGHSC